MATTEAHENEHVSFSKLTLFLRSARDPPSNKTRVLWEWLFWQARCRGVLPALEKHRKTQKSYLEVGQELYKTKPRRSPHKKSHPGLGNLLLPNMQFCTGRNKIK